MFGKWILTSLFLIGIMLPAQLTGQQAEETWPIIIDSEKGKITLYQPQPENMEDNQISGRAAISVIPSGATEPIFGAVWLESRVVCDRTDRLCAFEDIQVPIIRFPDSEDGDSDIEMIRELLETELPTIDYKISLDRLLASLDVAEETRELTEDFNNKAPEIIYSRKPAIMVVIDGAPQMRDYEKNFKRVINTPFFIVQYDSNNKYYLYGDGLWFVSSTLLEGWTYEARPPGKIQKLGKELEKENKESQEQESSDDLLGGKIDPASTPEIIVRTEPAELIQSKGEPDFRPITGTDLLYMENTESLVFLDINSQDYYINLSGRWYNSRSMDGPWKYHEADKLPKGFADIPEGSDRDIALAYVAGTEAAKEAIVDAYIPETATVNRQEASTEVTYDGAPRFEPVPGTEMEYAVNTAGTVLKVGNQFYCVDNGIWFESVNARGPWKVAVERPGEVAKIPPSSPVYNVKYVHIYDHTPEVVYVGYTPGYTGCYVHGPTIVYGTGWSYRPWYGSYYYPRHWTWGFNMHYNPWHGWSMSWSIGWGRPGGWYRPPYYYRPPGYGYRPPYYGGWWGPGYYRPPSHYPGMHNGYYGPQQRPSANRPRPDGRPTTTARPATRPSNLYAQRRDRSVRANEVTRPMTRPDARPGGTRPSTRPESRPGTRPDVRPESRPSTRPDTRPSTRPDTRPGPTTRPPNNIYTDKSGNVYQRDKSGNWQSRENGQWQNLPPTRDRQPTQQPQTRPSVDRSQLNRYNQNRQRGQQRTQTYRNYQQRVAPPRPQPRAQPRSSRNRGGR